MTTFADFVRALGINPPDHWLPGRWQRVSSTTHPKKKNCNVKLCEDGVTGFAVDFATMTEAAVWHANGEGKIERNAIDNAALSARLAKKREAEKRAIARAVACYKNAAPLTHANHDYMRKKLCDMNGARDLRVDADGWLICPMYRGKYMTSVQRISPDGQKLFATGAPTKGSCFRIWRPAATITILCEGLATGLTLFSAVPQANVVVCFSAANLVAVAEREDWQGMIAIAADNDRWTAENTGKNPGIEAAEKAAKIIGCGVAIPTCEGSDWNDFFAERFEMLDAKEEFQRHRKSPQSLRASAFAPIRAEIMRAVKFVPKKD